MAQNPNTPRNPGLRGFRPPLRRLVSLVGTRSWTLGTIALASTGAGLAEAGVLTLLAHIAEAMSAGVTQPALNLGPLEIRTSNSSLLASAAVLTAVRLLLQIVVTRLPARLAGQVQSELRTQLFASFLAAEWSEKAKEKEGHLQELMGDQAAQAGLAVLQLANGFSALVMLAALAASAFLLSATVAATVTLTTIVLFAALRPVSQRVRRRSAATSEAALSHASAVASSVRMAKEVEVFGVAEAERSKINSLIDAFNVHYVRTRTLSAVVPVLYQTGVISLLVGGLALLYALGAEGLASLGAVVLMLVRASSYGQQFQTAYQSVGSALPYLDRVSRAVENYRSKPSSRGGRGIDSVERIEFESVSFAYRPGVPVLEDINFTIEEGEAIGIVGPSGAGKSTLVELLLRLRHPSFGHYRVNGIPAEEIQDPDWHRLVAYLPQDPHLLQGTVAENIRFYRPLDDTAIQEAAKLAHIHMDITSWEEGYATVIGQRADAVSGGQRQRLCLARALAGSPKLLILDEPTSSLDPQSEHLIQQSLEELRGKVTLMMVAHRPSTLNLCDRVMVIQKGKVEAFGSTTELYGSNAFYRRAVDLAMAGKPL